MTPDPPSPRWYCCIDGCWVFTDPPMRGAMCPLHSEIEHLRATLAARDAALTRTVEALQQLIEAWKNEGEALKHHLGESSRRSALYHCADALEAVIAGISAEP
jgi:hypothetical protein